jgi:uncharacterized membrane protein
LDPRLSQAMVVAALLQAGLTVGHSLRARGGRRTALFAALGLGLPALGEYLGVNVLRAVRHHTQPQVRGVPLAAVLGWYNIGYATFAMLESILAQAGLDARWRRWAVPVGTALAATSLDLLVDCFGLDQGMWEWNSDGPYAREIAGPNGRQGIPLMNFAGWLELTGGVTAAYAALAGGAQDQPEAPGAAGSAEAGRTAAALLLPYYLPAVAWALWRRKPQYLLYSSLFPLAVALALTGEWRIVRQARPT